MTNPGARTIADDAIRDALECGNALLKAISANDVGLTGSHQAGFYLPKQRWSLFATRAPARGENHRTPVHVHWPDGTETQSNVIWYGRATRSEYRLTTFGKGFLWRDPRLVGSLLVLIRRAPADFIAHVLESEEDIESVQHALGVQLVGGWAAYEPDGAAEESVDDCVAREFATFVDAHAEFPPGKVLSHAALAALERCIAGFERWSPDRSLLELIRREYDLFRSLEERLCSTTIRRGFTSVGEFLRVAATLMNRRKARAGLSLEWHVAELLRRAGIQHECQPDIDGNPDIVVPSTLAYDDDAFPRESVFVLALKTTLKERWAQITNEAPRASHKYVLTLQAGVPETQMVAMERAGLILVVPRTLHSGYPPSVRSALLSVEELLSRMRVALGSAPTRHGQADLPLTGELGGSGVIQ